MEQPKFEGTPLPVETRDGIEVYQKPSGYYWRKAGNPLMHGAKDGGYETLEAAFLTGKASQGSDNLAVMTATESDRRERFKDDVERTTAVSPVMTGDGYEVWETFNHTFCWCLPGQEDDWLGHDELSFGGGFADVEAAARDAERILRIVRKVTEAAAAAIDVRDANIVTPVESAKAHIDSIECDVVDLGPIDPDNCIVVRLRSGTGFEQAQLASEVMAKRFPGLKYAIVAGEVDFFRVGKVDAPVRPPQVPSLGRDVHYVGYDAEKNLRHYAAKIVGIRHDYARPSRDVCDVYVYPTTNGGGGLALNVEYAEAASDVDTIYDTWHWPERVG